MIDDQGDRAADILEALLLEENGRDLGERRRGDEGWPGGQRIDFVYDRPPTGPPVALEVTRILVEDDERAWARRADHERYLQADACRERLGCWIVHYRLDADLRALRPQVLDFMRRGEECDPLYTSEQLLALTDPSDRERFREGRRRVFAAGLMRLERSDRPDLGVKLLPHLPPGRAWTGFVDDLAAVLSSNESKLSEARYASDGVARETHLVVLVHRLDVSRDPSLTPAPTLPPGLDHLWVIHEWSVPPYAAPIWHATRDADGWRRREWPTAQADSR